MQIYDSLSFPGENNYFLWLILHLVAKSNLKSNETLSWNLISIPYDKNK